MHALEITEERTFAARMNGKSITGLAVESSWNGLTKYVRADGDHLIVLDAEARVVTGSASLTGILGYVPSAAVHLNSGEIYVGIVDGQHVILLPGADRDNWSACMKWAASIGGDLPTRPEQALLYQKMSEHFEKDWYWSNTQHASNSDYAWGQDFYGGNQDGDTKSASGRARAVRRLPI